MQILQRCMEDMKAVYRLNEEKLEFNHRVLVDREFVNQKQEKALKNRQRKFLDQRRRRRGDYFSDMAKQQATNIHLTEQYKNFTKLFKLLQQKYKRFEKSDENRISLIQSMNEHEAKALVLKIMHADKVIHL